MPDPTTARIEALPIFSAGSWNGDSYAESDLDSMVEAFNSGDLGFKPTLKLGHADGQDNEATARKLFGAPAAGYVSRLYRKGKELLADIVDIPKKVADLIKLGAYKRTSAEIYWQMKQNGKTWPRVLKSIAVLGHEIPAVTSLDAVTDLYYEKKDGALIAYDDNKNEVHFYSADVVTPPSPPPTISVYREPTSHDNAGTEPSVKRDYIIEKRGEQYCLMSHDGKTLGCHDTEEECKAQETAINMAKHKDNVNRKTEAHMAEKDNNEELDEKIQAAVNKMRADMERENEYRVHKAYEEGKAEKDKETADLRAEIRKLEAEKRGERIDAWLYQMKEKGKMSPREESRVRALRNWIADEADKIKVYSSDGKGKVMEVEESPAKILESLFEERESVFKTYSKASDEEAERANEPLDDPGAELDRQAKKYQAEQSEKGNKVDYGKALQYAMKKDPALAQKYNNTRH